MFRTLKETRIKQLNNADSSDNYLYNMRLECKIMKKQL